MPRHCAQQLSPTHIRLPGKASCLHLRHCCSGFPLWGVLILFDGVTDRLIPLYAVGAFLAFTLSQSGMVMHWWKKRGAHWLKSAFVNGTGALVTGTTTAVVLLAKFVEGARITLLFVPAVIALFFSVRRHYHWVKVQTLCKVPVDVQGWLSLPSRSLPSTVGTALLGRELNLPPVFLRK